MAFANQEAHNFNHEYVSTEHILVALSAIAQGIASDALRAFAIDKSKIRAEIEKLIKRGSVARVGKLPHTPRALVVIGYAVEESQRLGHKHVGTEHLLLGILREHDGIAAYILMKLGVRLDATRNAILQAIQPNQ